MRRLRRHLGGTMSIDMSKVTPAPWPAFANLSYESNSPRLSRVVMGAVLSKDDYEKARLAIIAADVLERHKMKGWHPMYMRLFEEYGESVCGWVVHDRLEITVGPLGKDLIYSLTSPFEPLCRCDEWEKGQK